MLTSRALAGETKRVQIHPSDKDKFTNIATDLDPKQEVELINFLRENWDIFAWRPSDMPGVPRELAEHKLRVDPKARPVKESLRRFYSEKKKSYWTRSSKIASSWIHQGNLTLRVVSQPCNGSKER